MPVVQAHPLTKIVPVAMAQTSVSDPLLGLADAIEEHTNRQRELIECVRALRAFLVPAPNVDGTARGDSLLVTSPPPPPVSLTPPPVHPPPPVHAAPPPPPVSLTPPPVYAAPGSETLGDSADSPPQLLLRALKRDYDYFTELDEKLARLSIDLTTEDVDEVGGWPGASTS
jgi:hypothetical protein